MTGELAPAELWTARASAAADRHTMDTLGMPSPVLMERAALCVSAEIEALLDAGPGRGGCVLALVGPGNNGGDGLAIVRQLRLRDREVRAVMVTSRHNEAVAQQLELARSHGVEILDELPPRPLQDLVVVVDAMLGTGSQGAPRGGVADALAWLADAQTRLANVKVVAVDLPSGVEVDTGAAADNTPHADVTVSFGRSKPGLHLTPAREHAGEIVVADIGLVAPPAESEAPEETAARLIDPREIAAAFAKVPAAGHKGHRGHVGVIGGLGGTPGAAILAASAALRAGAGLATLTPEHEQLRRELIELRPELMLATGEDAARIPRADVLVVGPGMTGSGPRERLIALDREDARPMVWDAGALDHLEGHRSAGPRILTPHPGEAARMLARLSGDDEWSGARVQSNRRRAVERLAELTGAIVVLKGAGTILGRADTGELAICTTGGPTLATAGSGDVLAGVIAAFVARGLHPWLAAKAGVHVHGLAGDRCSEGAVAMDVADALAPALRSTVALDASAIPPRWPRWRRG